MMTQPLSAQHGPGGPKTAAGKARSAQNALTHGLAAAVALESPPSPEVERLAALVAGPHATPARLALARAFAMAQFELRRIRLARRGIFQRPEVDPPPSTHALIKAVRALRSGHALDPDRLGAPLLGGPRILAPWAAAAGRLRELGAVERYERRAFSRRQSALRALDALASEEAAGVRLCGRCDGGASPPPAPAAVNPDANLAERTQPAELRPATAAASTAPNLAERTRRAAPRPWTDVDPAPGPDTVPQPTLRRRRAKAKPKEPEGAWEMVATLAFVGLSHVHIAALLKISTERLRERFGDALECGPDLTLASLWNALLQRAIKGDTRAAIFFLRGRAGWRTTGPARVPALPTAEEDEAKQRTVDRILEMLRDRPP